MLGVMINSAPSTPIIKHTPMIEMIFAAWLYLFFPSVFSEVQSVFPAFPQYFVKISPLLQNLGIDAFKDMESFTVAVGDLLKKASSDIFSAVSVFFGGVVAEVREHLTVDLQVDLLRENGGQLGLVLGQACHANLGQSLASSRYGHCAQHVWAAGLIAFRRAVPIDFIFCDDLHGAAAAVSAD
jgi:hypothetical protein